MKKKINQRLLSRQLFYLAIILLPVIQFAIFYIYVNLNSFTMAFQKYEANVDTTGYTVTFAKMENFKEAWEILQKNSFMIRNSLVMYAFGLLFGTTLSIVFSYYIYKKYFLSGLFRVMLFLPQIISGLIFAILFKYIVTDVYEYFYLKITGMEGTGLLDNLDTRFGTVVFFNLWISFGISVLMYSNSMSTIDPSIVESAQLDGANTIKEFIYITLPSIYPTLVSFFIIGFTGIFTNQNGLFDMFGTNANTLATLGYYLFMVVESADVDTIPSFSVISALCLILTFVMAPITLALRKVLNRVGPSED
ncbi:MAG: sugar ABC transporter permease [Clostridiales bacterium]|nr:sugar ABC transporter permease [Clostridiales bacterium]